MIELTVGKEREMNNPKVKMIKQEIKVNRHKDCLHYRTGQSLSLYCFISFFFSVRRILRNLFATKNNSKVSKIL